MISLKKLIILCSALIMGVVLYVLLKSDQMGASVFDQLKSLNPQGIKDYVLGFGSWALGIFIGLYALNTVTLLPPIGIMSLAAGFIFGPLWGTVGIMAGSFIGTTTTFFISRQLGRGVVEKIIKGKAKEFEEKINEKGFFTILFMRLIPLFPWEMINYASGLTKIRYVDYMAATMIGIFPAVVIQTFFSDRVAHFDIRDPQLIIAIASFLLLIFVPTIYLAMKNKTKRA